MFARDDFDHPRSALSSGALQRAGWRCGESAQHIELRQRHGALLQRRQLFGKLLEQRFIEILFARQRAFASAQYLVFESLQFRRDVAFHRFQGLPANVFSGHRVGVRFADFDIKPVHPVVGDLERIDAGLLLFL